MPVHQRVFLLATMNESSSAAMTRAILGGVLMIMLVLIGATFFHHRYHVTKKLFFTMLSTVIVAVSVVLAALAINTLGSTTGLLERRTAELSFSVCGQQVQFDGGSVLSERIGGPRLYIHGTQIVAQSVMINEREDASLGALMQSIGGSITSNSLVLPSSVVKTNSGLGGFIKVSPSNKSYLELTAQPGCPSGPAVLNTYIYRYMSAKNTYVQYHLIRPEGYVFTANGANQKGDCVVIEYAKAANITNTTCSGYPATYELGGDL